MKTLFGLSVLLRILYRIYIAGYNSKMKLGRRKLICLLVDLLLLLAVASIVQLPSETRPVTNRLYSRLERFVSFIEAMVAVTDGDVGSGHLHRKFSEVEGWHRTALCLAAVIIWTCNPPYKAFLFSFSSVFRIFYNSCSVSP